ncbi:hypothetical protein AGDE_02534 [Angomonas deanei]|nr:hypothetical protein AGDE_02534 [Angomonas deanei]|eukprot:EPY41390.1 hypothetical protein AGDE_02534 [Angomonas deanei]
MRVHTEREGEQGNLAKTELDLLIAALDFHERFVREIMTPMSDITFVDENEPVVPDFIEKVWLSGRSRIPVRSANGQFTDILVVKDLLTVNPRMDKEFQPMTVSQLVKSANRLFAMVSGNTTLPAMLKFFQEAKTHMAVVFSDDSVNSSPDLEATRKSFYFRQVDSAQVIGIVTMEDVVEELLNAEIYDEYDRYDPADSVPSKAGTPASAPANLVIPKEPKKIPRVNFYSYFTHPESDIPLSDAQVWAVAYFLNRMVPAFVNWSPPYIKLLLDDVKDQQLVVPESPRSEAEEEEEKHSNRATKSNAESSHTFDFSLTSPYMHNDHTKFLEQAADSKFILYSKGKHTNIFTLTLGGRVDMLVGNDNFPTNLSSFNSVGEEALTSEFYIPEYSAVVMRAARVYRIPKHKYELYLSYQSISSHRASHIRVLGGRQPNLSSTATTTAEQSMEAPLLANRDETGLGSSTRGYGTL